MALSRKKEASKERINYHRVAAKKTRAEDQLKVGGLWDGQNPGKGRLKAGSQPTLKKQGN